MTCYVSRSENNLRFVRFIIIDHLKTRGRIDIVWTEIQIDGIFLTRKRFLNTRAYNTKRYIYVSFLAFTCRTFRRFWVPGYHQIRPLTCAAAAGPPVRAPVRMFGFREYQGRMARSSPSSAGSSRTVTRARRNARTTVFFLNVQFYN